MFENLQRLVDESDIEEFPDEELFSDDLYDDDVEDEDEDDAYGDLLLEPVDEEEA